MALYLLSANSNSHEKYNLAWDNATNCLFESPKQITKYQFLFLSFIFLKGKCISVINYQTWEEAAGSFVSFTI